LQTPVKIIFHIIDAFEFCASPNIKTLIIPSIFSLKHAKAIE